MPLELTPQTPPYYTALTVQGQQNAQPSANFVNTNNTGTNPQVISTITIPANTIRNIGDWLEWDIFVDFITASGAKTVQFNINAVNITELNSTSGQTAWFKIKGIYQGANQILIGSQSRSANTNLTSTAWALKTFNPTINNDLKCVVTNGIANDITFRYQTAVIFKV